MKLNVVTETILNPALAWLPRKCDTAEARVMVLTTGLQESQFIHRVQMGNGPARSFWQFERGTAASRGGVFGIYLHQASRELLEAACFAHSVAFTPRAIWEAIATQQHDILAAICARLLMLTDPYKLPSINDAQSAWELYAERTWRPGKPHRETWDAYHAAAVREVLS